MSAEELEFYGAVAGAGRFVGQIVLPVLFAAIVGFAAWSIRQRHAPPAQREIHSPRADGAAPRVDASR